MQPSSALNTSLLGSTSKISKRLLLSGFIVSLIALGNILYGGFKADQYETEIRETLEQMRVEAGQDHSEPFEHSRLFVNLDIDRGSQAMRRLVSRHGYYIFVRRGGNALLALAGVLLLGSILVMAYERGKQENTKS